MKVLASLSLAVIVASAAASPSMAGGVNVAGMWSGEMRQIDVDQETKYPMLLSLKGNKGTSSYPTLKCSGSWSRIGETKEGFAIYKEKITNEPGGSCIDGITIVQPYAGKLTLGWFATFDGAPTVASAVLAKDEAE
jgi:hypothetical protein